MKNKKIKQIYSGYRNKSEETMKTTKKETKIPKLRIIPEELEGIVNDMYELFQGDEFLFEKSFPEYTRAAAKRCWKKNGIGIYEPSPFKKLKAGHRYLNEAKSRNGQYKGSTSILYARSD